MRYRDAGVDIARADALKHDILAAVESTWTGAVQPLAGGFAGVMAFPAESGTPLLAATLDGVGTKLLLARAAHRIGDAAADLVFHGANDLVAHGARPLAFLDYVAQSRLEPVVVAEVVVALAAACRRVGAVLLGGETAEMPDTYVDGAIDVAGCMLGWVPAGRVLDTRRVRPTDVLLGLGSNGLHTNGFSLARRILSDSGLSLADRVPCTQESVADALLAPHRWYGPALEPCLAAGAIHALAHVTGGGIAGNLVRVLPEGVRATVRSNAWERPAVFRWLVEAGQVPENDARSSFNLGIGMIAVVAPEQLDEVMRTLESAGETVVAIGALAPGDRGVTWTE